MSDIYAYKVDNDPSQLVCDLPLTYDEGTGVLSTPGGTVKIDGTDHEVPAAQITISLAPSKAATVFAMLRQHNGTGAVDVGMYQFNQGDPVDFGADYTTLFQIARAVIPPDAALVDVLIKCWLALGS